MTTREFLALHDWKCAYCGGTATQLDHVVPSAMRRRHRIKHTDTRFHVAACGPCNWRKLTRRYYPRGFDTSILPGSPTSWQEWNGRAHLEAKR